MEVRPMTKDSGETGVPSQPRQWQPDQSQIIGNGSKRCGNTSGAVDVALAYARAGAYVLPLRRGGKLPHEMLGRGYEMRPGPRFVGSADEGQIRQWWQDDEGANVGVVTGVVSGLLVVDIDNLSPWRSEVMPEGERDRDGLHWLRHVAPDLPETVEVATASGGRHFWFQLSEPCATKIRWLSNVDVKADGGYVAVPPSSRWGVGEYRFLRTGPIAEAPSRMLADIRSRPGRSTTARTNGGGSSTLPPTDWFLANGFGAEGRRNSNCLALARRLWNQLGDESAVHTLMRRVWGVTEQGADSFPWSEAETAIRSAERYWRIEQQQVTGVMNSWGAAL